MCVSDKPGNRVYIIVTRPIKSWKTLCDIMMEFISQYDVKFEFIYCFCIEIYYYE